MDWPSDDPANKGGFVYYPGSSNAGEQELPGGKQALEERAALDHLDSLGQVDTHQIIRIGDQ